MNQSERFEYILKLEQEQSERKLKDELDAAKRASKQHRIALVTSYAAAQTIHLVMVAFGLCKKND